MGGQTGQIQLCSFGPDALKAMSRAFDQTWTEIASYFAGDPVVRDGARIALANAILSVASDDSRDVEVLKEAVLQALARNHKSLSIDQPNNK